MLYKLTALSAKPLRALAIRSSSGFALALFSVSALAAPPVPPTPGAIQDTVPQRRAPEVSTPGEVLFYNEGDAVEEHPESKRFLVSGFAFVGNTAVDTAVLQRLTERFLDFELTLEELDQVAANITAYYRNQGYTVARAFVPAQRVEDGLVTIQIIEGTLESVTFKGQKWYRQNFLQSYLNSFSVGKNGELVTDASLERRLLLLNDLPGLKARATLFPGESFGATGLGIDITEKYFDAFAGYSNAGRKDAGENRVDVGVNLNNPLTLGDQLSLRQIRSTDNLFDYKRIGYTLPLGSDGLKLAVSTLTTDYKLGGDFKALDISGKVRSSDISLSYPFTRSRAKNVIGAIQYRKTTTEQNVFGLPFAKSSLPLATASLYTNWVDDDSSATALNIAYSTNFWHNGSNADQDKVSSKLDTDLTYLTGATRNWDFFFHSQGVYSSAALPDTEKFSVGGPDSVRGYASAEIRGDKGYLVTMEMRRQWRISSVPGYVSLFVDMGGVNNKGFVGYDRIASAGVGLVFYAGTFGQFKAEYATPLTDWKASDGKNDRVWFNFSMGY